MDDSERMTLGMWIDYIIEWNNNNNQEKEKDSKGRPVERRKAGQADFDIF